MKAGWREVPLGSVTRIVNGGTPDTKLSEYWDGGIAWLTPKDMGKATNVHVESTGRTLSAAGLQNSSARTVPPGSVILSTRAPIGHLAINMVPMAFNQGCRGLVPGDDLLAKYLFFFLVGNVELLNELGTGTTFKELSAGALAAVAIPLPPRAEQERIVAILDEAFEAIATATSNAATSLSDARELSSLTIGSLIRTTDAGGTRRLVEVCDADWGNTELTKRAYVEDGPFLAVSAAGCDGRIGHAEHEAFVPVVSAIGARCGRMFLPTEPFTAIKNTMTVTPRANVTDGKFLFHALSHHQLPRRGAAQPFIAKGDVDEFMIQVPPYARQLEIVKQIEAVSDQIAELEANAQSRVALLGELKQASLARAFSGQLTASVLAVAVIAPANDNTFKTPEQVANIIAFAYQRHEAAGRSKTFGRVKAQKNLHLVESVGRVELGRQPWKDAAGPNDFPHMLRAEAWAKERGLFEFRRRSDGGYDFKKLRNYATMMPAAKKALAPIKTALARVTDLLTTMDSGAAEVLATVHAAWNNLILDGVEPTDDAIVREARDDWHPSKLKIAESKFRDAIELIRKKGIVPDGSAKRVAGQPNLL